MTPFEISVAVVVGLASASLVAVLADHVPAGVPMASWGSCPDCARRRSWWVRVPFVGWMSRFGARCVCGRSSDALGRFAEVLMLGLLLAIVARYGLAWRALPPIVAAVTLVALSVIDLRVYRLPNRLVFPAIAVSGLSMVVVAVMIDLVVALPRAVVGAFLFFALLFVSHLISPRGMGFGDVKFALLLGLHLGWTAGSTYRGWAAVMQLVFFALLLACVIGIVLGLLIGVLRRKGRDIAPDPEAVDGGEQAGDSERLLGHSFPFGPALAAASMLLVLHPDLVVPT